LADEKDIRAGDTAGHGLLCRLEPEPPCALTLKSPE
jgi:hypothetical protein